MNDPKYVAAEIIKTQRKGYREATVPTFMKILHDLGRTLPENSKINLIDFKRFFKKYASSFFFS